MERRICKFKGCIHGVDYKSTSYCRTHHKQFTLGQELTPIKRRGSGRSVCYIAGCDRFVDSDGLCRSHFVQRAKGEPFTTVKRIAKPGSGTIANGYRQITIDGKHILEHRYVMSTYLGRPLLPTESVHHKNGNRLDNRLSNLELWSNHQPSGQRVIDKIEWAKEILTQYADEYSLLITIPNDKNSK